MPVTQIATCSSLVRSRRVAWLWTVVGLLIADPTWAAVTGSVTGRVFDSRTGHALEGALVRVVGLSASTVTRDRGRFVLRDVEPGRHAILVEYIGLRSGSETITVIGGNTVTIDVWLNGTSGDTIETIVVRGAVTGEDRALNLQRSATNAMNVIAADAIGNFPDQNVAEALGRVPGVTVERNRGEGRYVTIRGIDSELNGYLSDGLSLAAPRRDERAVLLDIVPADALDRLEVSKTVLPDQPGDAIGGLINIRSPSAFTRGQSPGRGRMQLNYSELAAKVEPHLDAMFGGLFGRDETLGALVSLSTDVRKLGADSETADPWRLAEDPTSGEAFYLPNELTVRQYDGERQRVGVVANFEMKPDDESFYFLRGTFNEYTDSRTRQTASIELDEAGVVRLDESSALVGVGDEDALGETTFTQQLEYRVEELSLWGVSIGGENALGPLEIDYLAGYSYADEEVPTEFRAQYVLDGATEVEYRRGRSVDPRIRYANAGTDPRDAANFAFDETIDFPQDVFENHWEYAVNGRYEFRDEHDSYLQSGLRARFKNKRQRVEVYEGDSSPASLTRLDAISPGAGRNAFGTGFPIIDSRIRHIYEGDPASFSAERDYEKSTIDDWRSREDVLATYVMAGWRAGGLELTSGVRFEHTEFGTAGFAVDAVDESAILVGEERSYGDWLPGIHAKWSVTDALVVRAAYSEGIARPGFEQSAAAVSIDDDEIERGNPGLSQAHSRNIDLGVEYYLVGTSGLASAALFRKSVDDFLFPRVYFEQVAGVVYEVTSYANGRTGEVAGLEVGYQQSLEFLPPPFDRLGLYANAIFADSEAELVPGVGRTHGSELEIPFPRQSDAAGNFALTYEHGGVFVRAGATYRSGYIDRVGESPLEDRYFEDHLQWDIASRLSLGEKWTAFANLINVTDEPLTESFGRSDRLRRYESYSWSAQLGVEFVL
jgi:TonB-dependent receptor